MGSPSSPWLASMSRPLPSAIGTGSMPSASLRSRPSSSPTRVSTRTANLCGAPKSPAGLTPPSRRHGVVQGLLWPHTPSEWFGFAVAFPRAAPSIVQSVLSGATGPDRTLRRRDARNWANCLTTRSPATSTALRGLVTSPLCLTGG
jgi:hypothetical protein